MVFRLPLAVGIACALMFQSAGAQPKAQIKKTSTPPVIDGIGNDPVWANANAYGTTEFFIVEGAGAPSPTPIEASPDFTVEWRALWDNTNLYVMSKVNDDVIVNSLPANGGPDSANWEDDGIEFYIDAQDVNNAEFNGVPTEPTYQFTSLAGWTPAIANDPTYINPDTTLPVSPRVGRTPNTLPNTSITWGTNSYGADQAGAGYPQDMGSATSGPVTANPAGGFDWTFEASFPWEALQETPAEILAAPRNGIFGFGVAYNDDDFFGGTHPSPRENQYMWATNLNNLWHVSSSFPDVQLVDAPAPVQGDYNSNGTVDAADYVRWRDNPGAFGGDPAGFNTWRANFGKTTGPASAIGGAVASPEPATLLMFLLLTTPWVLCRKRR